MVFVLEIDDLQNGYIDLLKTILAGGEKRSPRGMETIDLGHTTVVLKNPEFCTPIGVGRNLNLALASAETTHLIAGISDAHQLVSIAPVFKRFMNEHKLLGAYGPRLRDQMPLIFERLCKDSETRQAVAMIWRSNELEDESNHDVPCTIALMFRVEDGELHMFTQMRSNDAFLGVPYDFTMFTRLQSTMAWALGVKVGTYTHAAWSMHIYAKDIEAIDKLHRVSSPQITPVFAYGVGRHDSNPGERSYQTTLKRWYRATHWAKLAMLDVPTQAYMNDGALWHRGQLRDHWSRGLYCSHCHYVLPRTKEVFWALGRENVWKSRCRECVMKQTNERPSSYNLSPKLSPERRLELRCMRFGVDVAWYEAKLKEQNNVCAICKQIPDNGRFRDFVIDHDHATGIARGLLCSKCNHGLGLFGDDPIRMKEAAAYLTVVRK